MPNDQPRLPASRPAPKSRRRGRRPNVRYTPNWNAPLDILEARVVLSGLTYTWTGADSANSSNWSDPLNWSGNFAPLPTSNLVFPASASSFSPNNNYAILTTFASIDIQGANYDITGNSVTLTGNLNASLTSSSSLYELNTNLASGIVDVAGGGTLYALGVFSGSEGLELTGGGALQLRGSAVNTFSGTTLVDNGTLTLDNITGRYAVPGALTIGGSGTGIVHEGNSRQINPNSTLTVNTNGDFNVDGGTETVGGLNLIGNARIYTGTTDGSLPGLLTLNGDVNANASSGSPQINGVINLGTVDRTFDVTAGTTIVYATVQGTHALNKTGTGTLFIQDSYQDPGAVNINAGEIQFQYGGSIDESSTLGITVASGASMLIVGTGNITVPVTIAGNGPTGAGALENGYYYDTLSNLTLAGNASIGSDNVIQNAELTITGITDGGSGYHLTKVGTGVLNLAGTNTFSGGSTVDAGLLYISGSVVGTTQTVTGGQLGGNGTIAAASSAGGTIGAGGTSQYEVATEQYSSLTLDSTTTFSAQINGSTAGSGYSQVIVSGAVALNGATLGLPTYNYTPGGGDSLVIIKGATSLTGTFNNDPEGTLIALAGGNFRITYVGGTGGNDVILNRVVPSTTVVTYPSSTTVYGQSATFTATVAAPLGGTPTGTVTFYNGSTNLGTATLSGGVASLTTTVLPVGNDVVTASYSGDVHDLTSDSTGQPVTQQVFKDNTTATVATSSTPTVYGQSVTITATLSANAPGSGTPTGTVQFFDGATLLTTPTLVAGVATYTSTTLTPGVHHFSVAYSGDVDYFLSNSSQITQTITKASSTASAPTSSGATRFGQSVTFTTTVTSVAPGSGTPTGTVTFFDGATSIGTGTLNGSGVASLTLASLAAGTHSITATYGSDADYLASTSSATSQVVSQTSTTNSLTTSTATSSYGQPVTFTSTIAAVAPGAGTPTGTVTFFDGSTSIGTGTLNGSGVATLVTGSLGFGPHTISATYGGSSNFVASTSSNVSESVTLATATMAATSSANPAVYGQAVTLHATLTPPFAGAGTPSGTVTFFDGAIDLGTATLSGGTASLAEPPFSIGSHSITFTYSGDSNYQAGTSPAMTLVVNKASSTETVAPPAAVTFGQSATLTLSVAAASPGTGTPSGNVTFYDGSTLIGSGTLDGLGSDTISVSGLSAGAHSITAHYAGDADFNSTTTSAAVTLTINKSGSTETVASPSPITYGQAAALSLTVAATAPGSGTPTGSVTFFDGGIQIGIVSLSGGTATFNAPGLTAGNHAITASYAGDSNFSATTTTGSTTLVVGQSSTSATLTAPGSLAYGQPGLLSVTIAAVAPGSGTPTGMVTFFNGSTSLGTAALNSSGVAQIFASTLSVGSHSITASYAGDSNFIASASSATTVQVNQSGSTTTVAPTTSVVFGQQATLSATVAANAPGSGTPTGTVRFFDGSTLLGSVALDNTGTATISETNFTVGNHSITADYLGDVNFLTSNSASKTQVVAESGSTATVTPPASIVLGQSATLTATVAANAPGSGTPTGTVTFYDGSTSIGTGTLNSSGSATISVSGLLVGNHSITAAYASDGNFLSTTSAAANLSVSNEGTTTTLTPVTTSSTFGQGVTFTVGVASNGPESFSPTGTVNFYDGTTLIGSSNLDAFDNATLSISSLTAGSHSISAVYAGDSEFGSSTSQTTIQVVTSRGRPRPSRPRPTRPSMGSR